MRVLHRVERCSLSPPRRRATNTHGLAPVSSTQQEAQKGRGGSACELDKLSYFDSSFQPGQGESSNARRAGQRGTGTGETHTRASVLGRTVSSLFFSFYTSEN